MLFSFFSKFWFSSLLGGVRAKMTQIEKNSVPLIPYQRNCTSYDFCFWCTCVRWWYLEHVFSFFQNSEKCFLGGGGGGGVKGQKMIQNYQFKSVTLYILRTVDNIIRLLVCRCKMISLGVLSVFFKNIQIIVNINIFMFFIGPLQTFLK